jgi:hypothetical protein
MDYSELTRRETSCTVSNACVDSKSAASGVPPRGQTGDSTVEIAMLEAIAGRDWERLGVLLGAFDQDLRTFVGSWNQLPPELRHVLRLLAIR